MRKLNCENPTLWEWYFNWRSNLKETKEAATRALDLPGKSPKKRNFVATMGRIYHLKMVLCWWSAINSWHKNSQKRKLFAIFHLFEKSSYSAVFWLFLLLSNTSFFHLKSTSKTRFSNGQFVNDHFKSQYFAVSRFEIG